MPLIGGLRLSAPLSRRLALVRGEFDIVHVHGLWNWPSVAAARAAARAQIPLVLAPRGMLSPGALRISRFKKWFFWRLLQRPAIRHLACFHATSELEAQELMAFGAKWKLDVPIAIVPNGVDIPDFLPRPPRGGAHTLLYLGRIHPKKGLDVLIRAWSQIAEERPDWRLQIVGPDERGHADELKRLVQHLRAPRVAIEGPRYGPDKLSTYRSADIFVLPSRAENFGVTVVEALAAEIPVIATKSTPWQALEEQGCGWWIDEGIESLAAALRTSTGLAHQARAQMGAAGRSYVSRTFRWDSIGRDMAGVYEWLLKRGPLPPFVRLP